jgi:hypothetical protein
MLFEVLAGVLFPFALRRAEIAVRVRDPYKGADGMNQRAVTLFIERGLFGKCGFEILA